MLRSFGIRPENVLSDGGVGFAVAVGILHDGKVGFGLRALYGLQPGNGPFVAVLPKLEIRAEEGPGLSLYCDGRFECTLKAQDTATLKKAEFCVEFIKRKDSNFFDKLLLKLTKWSK